MKDAVSYWYCNDCSTEFQVEEEPGYANLAECGWSTVQFVTTCPFCGSANIETIEEKEGIKCL